MAKYKTNQFKEYITVQTHDDGLTEQVPVLDNCYFNFRELIEMPIRTIDKTEVVK